MAVLRCSALHVLLAQRLRPSRLNFFWLAARWLAPCCQLVDTLLDYYGECAVNLEQQIFLQEMPRTRSFSLIQQAYVCGQSSGQETNAVRPCPLGNHKKSWQWRGMPLTTACQVRSSLTLDLCAGSSSSRSSSFSGKYASRKVLSPVVSL